MSGWRSACQAILSFSFLSFFFIATDSPDAISTINDPLIRARCSTIESLRFPPSTGATAPMGGESGRRLFIFGKGDANKASSVKEIKSRGQMEEILSPDNGFLCSSKRSLIFPWYSFRHIVTSGRAFVARRREAFHSAGIRTFHSLMRKQPASGRGER